MKFKALLLIIAAAMTFSLTAEAQSLPRKVRNVELQDLDTKKARLPWWGELWHIITQFLVSLPH